MPAFLYLILGVEFSLAGIDISQLRWPENLTIMVIRMLSIGVEKFCLQNQVNQNQP